MKTRRLVIVTITAALLLGGCASAKMLYREMPNDTSESAIILKGKPFRKKPIIGKGCEVIVYGDMKAKITTKDGSIIEVTTIKASMFEKMFGWLYILKPNNVGVGK